MLFVVSTLRGGSGSFRFPRRCNAPRDERVGRTLGQIKRVLCGMGTRATRRRGCCRLVLSFIDAKLLILGSGKTMCRGGGRTLQLLKLGVFARVHRLDGMSTALVRGVRGYHPKSGLRIVFRGRQKAIGLSVHISRVGIRGRRLHVLTLGSVGVRLSRGRVSS